MLDRIALFALIAVGVWALSVNLVHLAKYGPDRPGRVAFARH